MFLNTISPGVGASKTRKRLGRGIGSGLGKTCGKGHKGQTARAGGYHRIGFEGGQNPLFRRVPKFGFNSYLSRVTVEVRLSDLLRCQEDVIDINALHRAGVISKKFKRVKVIGQGEFQRKVTLKGLKVTRSVREVIESAGGAIEA